MTASPTLPAPESLSRMARHAMVILAVIAVFIALKLTAHVMVPLVLAIFLIIIAWPIKVWLDHHLPQSLSYTGSLVALTFVVAVLVGAMWASGLEIVQHAPVYQPIFESFLHEAKHALSAKGVDTHGKITLDDVKTALLLLGENFKESIVMLCITLSYVILAIPEAARWKNKIKKCFGKENSEKLLSTTTEMSQTFQAYITAVVIGGIINAAMITALSLLLGLDFPVTWGVLIFLLNFIPTIGPTAMPIMMTLLAFLQFDAGSTMPYLVFFSVSAVQLFIGSFIDPRLQGNMLALSPVVVLFSLTFWGFLWGIPGALLSTPLTHGIIIACSHFPQTRWLACMLAEARSK
ncbi:MAG TPA: AI-2E family transporter [Alphaproteobacteria bacterium]|nr:AI-2E family transporter [Alphaproteobacteria bacterium]